ncbi:unnamed protein product [Mytilus coruscus]|uniref:SAP domain-containing protein n=1 Tax=Mytilus coruscus TaxID=42192 RepID=A0A6J8ALE7_MYTCO|nr:unnamed protein product [Mytilus coruscus]
MASIQDFMKINLTDEDINRAKLHLNDLKLWKYPTEEMELVRGVKTLEHDQNFYKGDCGNVQLKRWLQCRGVKTGNKPELIQRCKDVIAGGKADQIDFSVDGGKCSTLFINKHVKEHGYDPLACTAKPCEWNQGKKTGKNPSKISDAIYSSYKQKAVKLCDFDPRPQHMRQVPYDAKKEFVNDLKYHGLTGGKSSMWESLLNSIITYDNYALDEERKIMLQDLTWSFFTNIRSDGSKFKTNAYMIPGTEPQSESEQWKSSRWFE